MNIVTRVTYQNFFVAGNVPIVVDLTKHRTTLVIGENGSGKSTLYEAISFAWFGKPVRNINKPALVNWVNSRDCLVELEWKLPTGVRYKVRRGIKPNLFEIYKNDVLEPIPADIDEYQAHLESIIKLNHKSFMQVVVLGGSSYVPFMRLKTAARRAIIEDLLDIEVFSSMNVLAKEDLTEVKTAIDKNGVSRSSLTSQIAMAHSFEAQAKDDTKARVDAIEASITETKDAIAVLQKDRTKRQKALIEPIKQHQAEQAEHDADEKAVDAEEQAVTTAHQKEYSAIGTKPYATAKAAKVKVDEYNKTLYTLQAKRDAVAKERAFYEQHDNCPTCEQTITDAFKDARYATLTQTQADIVKAMLQCKALIEKWTTVITDAADEVAVAKAEMDTRHNAVQQELRAKRKALRLIADALRTAFAGLQQQRTELSTVETKISMHQRRVKELEAERTAVLTPKPSAPVVDIAALEAQLDALHTQQAKLSSDRVVLDAAAMLLKDSGIKTRVIKHYLPIINKFINSYLTQMDFSIAFTFDEEFEEHIKTTYGDSFAYEQFSDGEKKRIDLALLLTWRAVARLKNSAACNILVLDEVFDSALDLSGMEAFLKIIHGLEADANVFVMSHRTDQMIDKFAHVLTYEKMRGFSQIKAA